MVHGADAAAGRSRPRVFISYAHDDAVHVEKVEKLYQLLRVKGGLEAQLDLYASEQPQDWAAWMRRQCAEARYILVIASPAYKRRGDQEEQDGAGLGVVWESRLLREELYRHHLTWHKKILLVVLPGRSEIELPEFFTSSMISRFHVRSLDEAGIEGLVRYMTEQPYRVEPPVGPIPVYNKRASLLHDPSASCVDERGTRARAEALEGSHTTGGGPAADLGGLTAAAWRELSHILVGVAPERWSEQAYLWSFGEIGSTSRAAAPYGVPAGDLYEWAGDLGARRHTPGDLPKAVAFAHALATGYAAGESPADRQRARQLHSWVDRWTDGHGPTAPLPAPLIQRPEATLTVRLVEHPQQPETFYCEVWLRTLGDGRPRRLQPPSSTAPLPVDLNDAKLLLEGSMRDLGTAALGKDGRRTEPLMLRRIEFAVPDGLLEEPFDQWEIRIGRQGRPLGKTHQVVVRCLDQRWGADHAARWTGRWKWLNRESGSDERATVWVEEEHDDCLDDLVGEWCETDHPACVAVAMSQAERGVAAALDAGMPVVVWQRQAHRGDPSVPPLPSLLQVHDVHELPLAVKQLRRDRNQSPSARASVVLLWDDADHPMTPDPLSDANLIA